MDITFIKYIYIYIDTHTQKCIYLHCLKNKKLYLPLVELSLALPREV